MSMLNIKGVTYSVVSIRSWVRISWVFLVLFFVSPLMADASITQFQSNVSNAASGQATTLTWITSGSSGAKLRLACARGLLFFNESGSALSCGSYITDLPTSGGYIFSVVNVTSSLVGFQATLVAKNPNGTYDDANPSVLTLYVIPALTVISDFTASPQEVISGNELTLNWSSNYIKGVNIKFSCTDALRVRVSGTTSDGLCTNFLFATDLSPTASTKIILTSERDANLLVTFTLFPAVGDGTYEGGKAKSVQVTVKPLPLKIPKLTLVQSLPLAVVSGSPYSFSWAGTDIVGVNFIVSCAEEVTATSSHQVLPCGAYALTNNLASSGTTTLAFINKSKFRKALNVRLLPALDSASYNALLSHEMRFDVLPEGMSLPQVTVVSPIYSSPITSPSAAQAKPRYSFSRYLVYGLRNNADVRALQEILTFEGVYSGPITGNFFGLTQEGVKRFQKKYGIEQAGSVGPLTRRKLNEFYSK